VTGLLFKRIQRPYKMKTVYGDMVGDLFHHGHVEFIKTLRQFGDKVIVGVIGDKNASLYKRKPICSLDERVKVITACKYVDEVIPNSPLIIDKDFIQQNNIDLVVHAHHVDDQSQDDFFKVPIEMGIFHRVKYTPNISTTELIQRCSRRNGL